MCLINPAGTNLSCIRLAVSRSGYHWPSFSGSSVFCRSRISDHSRYFRGAPIPVASANLASMDKQETIDEITQLQIEVSLKAAQMNLARAEEQLALKKVNRPRTSEDLYGLNEQLVSEPGAADVHDAVDDQRRRLESPVRDTKILTRFKKRSMAPRVLPWRATSALGGRLRFGV